MSGRGAPKGNRNGAKGKDFESAIRRALAQHKTPDALRAIAAKVVDAALEGNLAAVGMIADRLDGKPAQGLDVDVRDFRKSAREFQDDELATIASGGSLGTAGEAEGAGTVN